MKVLVFGTGEIYKQNANNLNNFDILAFLDNDKFKQGKYLDGKLIEKPENHYKYNYEGIILASEYYLEMREQLIGLDVSSEKIVDVKNKGVLSNIKFIKKYTVRKENKGKRILLVSSELANTGAQIVLFEMAKILVDSEYDVDFLTTKSGPMLYDFLSLGVNVYISEWWEDVSEERLLKYNLIILNTILVRHIAMKLVNKDIPVIWWIHEEKKALKKFKVNKDEVPLAENIHVFGVSGLVNSAYIELTGSVNIDQLLYGLEYYEVNHECNDLAKDKYIFAIIGYVGKTKGHDILLEAIKNYNKYWANKIEFWIIGSISDRYRKLFENFGNIRLFGVIDHDRLMNLYSKIDVVLCPSRYESMSVAVIEALMNKKLTIVSSNTGNAKFITPYKNGLIMQSESAESLAEQMNWALENIDRWQEIGDKGYKVYDEYFRLERFEKIVLSTVNKFIK